MDTKIDFEKALRRLEELADKLEGGDLSLDESMQLFEEGIKLSKLCEKKLNDTEQKVEILNNLDVDDIIMEETHPKKTKAKQEKSEPEPEKDTDDNFLF